MLGPEVRQHSRRRGFVLAGAIFALAVLGAIVGCGFYLGLVEQQSGRNTVFAFQAAEAAEAQLRQALRNTSVSTLMALPAGGVPLTLDSLTLGPGVGAEASVSRLGINLFLLRSQGVRYDAAGGALASRRLGMLVRSTRDSLEAADVVAPIEQRAWLQLY